MDLYDENIARLIRHSLTGELSEQERGELEAWLHDSEEHRVLFEKIKKEIRISSENSFLRSLNDEVAWLKFKTTTRERKRRVYVRRILTYAAVIVLPLAVVVGCWFLSQEKDMFPMASERVVKITPGRPQAVLITADQTVHELNGVQEQREIEVEKGVMIKQGGANLEYDSLVAPEQEVALAMNTLKVPRGGEFRLKLSDGTNVYLNSASDLKYPVRFVGKERRVYLSGEAYFEVQRDTTKPFIVVMNGNEVRVLGTEFNVRSYKDEKCQFTTLVTGKVLLTTYDRKCMELLPNEQGIVDPQGDIRKEQVDVALYTAWKDGNFVFRKQSLEHIMEIVERWYDLKVTFEDEWCKQVSFSGNVERYDDFSKLAEMLEATGSVKFRIKNNEIYVTKR